MFAQIFMATSWTLKQASHHQTLRPIEFQKSIWLTLHYPTADLSSKLQTFLSASDKHSTLLTWVQIGSSHAFHLLLDTDWDYLKNTTRHSTLFRVSFDYITR